MQIENVEVSEEWIALGNDVRVPTRWTALVSGEPGVPGVISIEALYEPLLNRAVAAEVRVARQGEGDEVTSLTLREIRVQYALQVSGLRVSTVAEPGYPVVAGATYLRRMRERTERDLTASVVDAARVYQLSAAINMPPLKTVADSLGVSQSTATRLMNRARMEGLAPGVNLPDPAATGPYLGPTAPSGPVIGR